ncbi:MAG: hypothetical protein M1544_00330 [Candidatus Marsarchaeota archaeon]|nr:hypothetical protein [Candidatus Marsarchaeota archaeon]
MAIVLSFDIIEALLPVIIILFLIAAAAGLTRGSDIFALFGLGAMMGFAKSGGGRVGKGFKGTRYGGDAIRRKKAAGKGGIMKKARGIRKTIKGRNSKAALEKKQQIRQKHMVRRAKNYRFMNRRLQKLRAQGKGNTLRARGYEKALEGIKNANIKSAKKTIETRKKIDTINNMIKLAATGGAVGGMVIGRDATGKDITLSQRLSPRKIKNLQKQVDKYSGKNQEINNELSGKQQELRLKLQDHFIKRYGKTSGYGINVRDYLKLSKEDREKKLAELFNNVKTGGRVTVGNEGFVLGRGNMKSSPKYVQDRKLSNGSTFRILKVPKSGYVQKGAVSAAAVATLQRSYAKGFENSSKELDKNRNAYNAAKASGNQKVIDKAEKELRMAQEKFNVSKSKLDSTNDYVAKIFYGKGSANDAFKAFDNGQLLSKTKQRQKNIFGVGGLPPGVSHVAGAVGGHSNFGEFKVSKLPGESFSNFRERAKDLREINKLYEINKDHTLRHPIKGVKGVSALEEEKKNNNEEAFRQAYKKLKKVKV